MKHFSKIMALILSLIICLSVTACGKNEKEDTGDLVIARWDMSQVNTAKKRQTPLYKAIKEATGTDVTVMSISNNAYEDKLNMLYAANELPDIFVSTVWDTPSVYRKWIKDGAVANLSKYVTEKDYPNIYARLKQFEFLSKTITYAGGSHYAIPLTNIPMHGMYIRTDWIENLNNKLGSILQAEGITTKAEYDANPSAFEEYKFKTPQTLTEFYRLAYAFTNYDPDGNGSDDTYGYSCCSRTMWYNNWIFEAMSTGTGKYHDSTYWGFVDDGNGGVTASWVTEGNKQAVAFLNKLYQEKILDPDYIVNSESDCRTSFIKGKVGMYLENNYYNTILGSFMDTYGVSMEEGKKMFTIISTPAGEYGQGGTRTDPGFWRGVCINGKMNKKRIQRALKYLDYLMSDEATELFTYGIEGVHYKVENGERVSLMGKDANGFNRTLETYDYAFPLSSLATWNFAYNSPYESNREEIDSIFAAIKSTAKRDMFCILQTENYMEYDLSASNNACEYFVGMIKDGGLYNSSLKKGLKVGLNDFDQLTSKNAYNAKYNSEWSDFCNKYKKNWKGDLIVSELAAKYPSVSSYYDKLYEELNK